MVIDAIFIYSFVIAFLVQNPNLKDRGSLAIKLAKDLAQSDLGNSTSGEGDNQISCLGWITMAEQLCQDANKAKTTNYLFDASQFPTDNDLEGKEGIKPKYDVK